MGMGDWLATAMFSAHSDDHMVAATSQDAQLYRAAAGRDPPRNYGPAEAASR